MKRYFTIVFIFILFPLGLYSQGSMKEQYDRFKNQALSTYSSFREQSNREYIEFLKQAWTFYQLGAVIEIPEDREVPPVILNKGRHSVPIDGKELEFDEVISIPDNPTQPQPLEPVIPQSDAESTWHEFTFFGTQLKVRASESNRFVLESVSEETIANAWEMLSGKDFDHMLADCLAIREEYNLCDWAYLLMLSDFSDSFLQPGNESTLLSAYLFCQSGYKMRLGEADGNLCLLFGSKHQIYGAPYFDIDGDYYYSLTAIDKGMRIANFTFPKEQALSLSLSQLPSFSLDESTPRPLIGKGYGTVSSCSVNKNLINFLEGYPTSQLDNNPMTRWALYANAPLDTSIKNQVYPSLQQAIHGKSQSEAVDILLDYVQTAFTYGYDEQIWGLDRAFFSEETYYYPYCDCEDRSILFSRLVRDLVGIDVMLVYTPGHLSTAVKIDEPCKGDYIALNNDRYIICDPTYVGAPVGVSIPRSNKCMAKVILLK